MDMDLDLKPVKSKGNFRKQRKSKSDDKILATKTEKSKVVAKKEPAVSEKKPNPFARKPNPFSARYADFIQNEFAAFVKFAKAGKEKTFVQENDIEKILAERDLAKSSFPTENLPKTLEMGIHSKSKELIRFAMFHLAKFEFIQQQAELPETLVAVVDALAAPFTLE